MERSAGSTGPGTGLGAVVLAGGRAARLGGADKASVKYLGRTLLEHAIEALVDAEEIVVVGDPVPTSRPVTFTREDPRHGGPVAALLAGCDALARRPGAVRVLGVLAVDMPRVGAGTFRRLRAATTGHDGAFLADAEGRRQLCGVLDPARLAAVSPDLEQRHGMALHRLLAALDLAEVAAEPDEARDVDTWTDLRDLPDDRPDDITPADHLRPAPVEGNLNP